jgi:hypothetical protein
MMRVRLKRDICGCIASMRSGLFERNRFGVPDLFVNVKAFADYFAATGSDHATDKRTRTDLPQPARCEFQSAPHHAGF